MIDRRSKTFLPKVVFELQTVLRLFKTKLQRFRGSKKQLISINFSKLAKLAAVFLIFFYLSGYQPTWAIPPIKKSVAKAEDFNTQSISATKISDPFKLPHPGYVSTYFSAWHPGVDIATGLGMPVHPIAKGKIIDISYSLWGLGHSVTIEHSDRYKSTYGHMGRIYNKVGDNVTTDSIIGEVGLTGHTTGPHTHLEITKNGNNINPLTLLPKMEDISVAWRVSTPSATGGR